MLAGRGISFLSRPNRMSLQETGVSTFDDARNLLGSPVHEVAGQPRHRPGASRFHGCNLVALSTQHDPLHMCGRPERMVGGGGGGVERVVLHGFTVAGSGGSNGFKTP